MFIEKPKLKKPRPPKLKPPAAPKSPEPKLGKRKKRKPNTDSLKLGY